MALLTKAGGLAHSLEIDSRVAMETHLTINTAIESFDDWERPWAFFTQVSSLLAPDVRREFERTWATATEAAVWSTCKDPLHGCALANERLSVSYPWLSGKARRQLVSGAAYQWR